MLMWIPVTLAQVAVTAAVVLVGAGDIGRCGSPGAGATAALADSVLRAEGAAQVRAETFTLGDNAYPDGSRGDFARCFAPTWGDSTKLLMGHIHPAVGNHEYRSKGASPYYEYFGSRAGPPGRGYYSYDVGTWHAIVLNSAIVASSAFSDAERRAQEEWLEQDLKLNRTLCTVAYWHHPRFSSGIHGTDSRLSRLWEILYAGGVDLVINGHDHDYERFLPQTPEGVYATTGITQIVAGTGGGDLRAFRQITAPHSAYRVHGRYGVLKLTLGQGTYSHAFVVIDGSVLDQGSGTCH